MLYSSCMRATMRLFAAFVSACVLAGQCLPAGARGTEDPMAFLPGRMNLGSVHKTAQAPDSLTSQMTIVNGGTPMEVTAGMRLTPAQALALAQVMQTGSQSIVLGTQGKAIGGFANLTGLSSFTSLHVPRGVSVLDDFAANQSLQLKGDLV